MALIDRIKSDRTNAIKNRDAKLKSALTVLIGEVQRLQKTPSHIPSDEEVIARLKSLVKDINKTINNRKEQNLPVDEQLAELKIYQKYQPTLMTDDELLDAVNEAIATVNATSIKQIGAVMGYLSKTHKGKFDGRKAKDFVQGRLDGK